MNSVPFFYCKVKYLTCALIVFNVLLITSIIILWNPNGLFLSNIGQKENLTQIHIISKAAIGSYLWLHLISGEIISINNDFFQNGSKTINGLNFTYLSGPGYIQTTIPQDIEYMVLVLNGRTSQKVDKSKEWLDYMPKMKLLKKLAVILLGSEECDNDWVLTYMKNHGGLIDVLFIVYDANIVNDIDIMQWPLGVATYRGFPITDAYNLNTKNKSRQYKCNFVGTVYKNSSRERLVEILKNLKHKNYCFVQLRERWQPNESLESLRNYVDVLQNSDLTLCPIGMNTECYRIYEAMSVGSIPVVEDRKTKGKCGLPLRILKKYNAPLIYIKNWKELDEVLLSESSMNIESIIIRRKGLLDWYEYFKRSLVSDFVFTLKSVFSLT